MAFHKDLDEAVKIALRDVIEFLVKNKGLNRDYTYAMASLVVHLRVAQIGAGNKGIHAIFSNPYLKK